MITNLDTFSNTAEGWQRSLYAFLAEKEQRSGSRRTVEGYSRMLQDFFGRVGKQPDKVTSQDIFVYAHGPGLSGKQPSAITIGARIACISSFYHFLIRMDIVQSNPCDKLQRPKISPSPPRGLSGNQIQTILTVIAEFSDRTSRPGYYLNSGAHRTTPGRSHQYEGRQSKPR